MDWSTIYDFAEDATQIEAMQRATLSSGDFGLSPSPALVATSDWWRAIEAGKLARHVVEGTITRVLWGSMGDWPEFELTAADGAKSRWTREGDISRYVEGLRARLTYVLHPWKVVKSLGSECKIVLLVELEESVLRSDPRAPGPGGVGLR